MPNDNCVLHEKLNILLCFGYDEEGTITIFDGRTGDFLYWINDVAVEEWRNKA